MKRSLAVIPALALLLAGCASGAEVEPTVTPSETVAEVEAKDVTSEVKAVAKDLTDKVTKATETEPGRYEVETTIVDPRGDDGSMPAMEAVRLCNLVVKGVDGLTNVNILEEDGTTFAAYGVSIINDGECGEY